VCGGVRRSTSTAPPLFAYECARRALMLTHALLREARYAFTVRSAPLCRHAAFTSRRSYMESARQTVRRAMRAARCGSVTRSDAAMREVCRVIMRICRYEENKECYA